MILQFLRIMLTEFVAEMGDKTQLMLLGLTSRYKLRDILIGTACAILVLNGVAVLAGGLLGSLLSGREWIVKLVAALAFLFFAITSLKADDGEEEKAKLNKLKFAPLAVFCTFFVAELGDKTQLTAVTFGANEGIGSAVVVWLACSIGLFLADVLGVILGHFLKNKLSAGVINKIAFLIFAVFGIYTVYQFAVLRFPDNKTLSIWITVVSGVVFAVSSLIFFLLQKKKQTVEVK